ncbi:DNA polymerase lambda-like protein [Drosera capensis]
MAPKRNPPNRSRTKSQTPQPDPTGIFSGMVVFLVDAGVQPRRLQIWKQRLEQLGAVIEEGKLNKSVTHVFATSWDDIAWVAGRLPLASFKGKVLVYQWLEDSLSRGEKVDEDLYIPKKEPTGVKNSSEAPGGSPADKNRNSPECHEAPSSKRLRSSSPEAAEDSLVRGQDNKTWTSLKGSSDLSGSESNHEGNADAFDSSDKSPSGEQLYHPPDLSKNVTGIFKKLIDIYRALGDERSSFSYYKVILVIEKLPFKIESVDQIQEIVTAGKLSKLEHFEKDEKVKVMEKLLQKVGEEVLPGVEIVCGGSYRRGKSSCGDVDIVITHPDGQSHKGFLAKYVKRLKELNFLRDDLVFSTHSDKGTDSGVDTYFGLCTYPSRELRHRIDLKAQRKWSCVTCCFFNVPFVPPQTNIVYTTLRHFFQNWKGNCLLYVYPRDIHTFGLIAWTGNDTLNRRLCLLAESKGYRLDDTGLFPATHSSGGKRGVRGTASLHLNTEKEKMISWSCSKTLPSPSPLLPLHILPPPLATLPFRPLRPPPSPANPSPSSLTVSAVARPRRTLTHICRAAGEYQFPDPIPEFAEAETEKFREYMVERLSKRMDIFEDQDTLDKVVDICAENLSTFLHEEYGGPGTLMVEPFAAMASDLEDEDLPRGPQVARIAIKWGQANIDKDWNEWTSRNKVR